MIYGVTNLSFFIHQFTSNFYYLFIYWKSSFVLHFFWHVTNKISFFLSLNFLIEEILWFLNRPEESMNNDWIEWMKRPNIFDISCHKGKHAFFCTINIERDERNESRMNKFSMFQFSSGSNDITTAFWRGNCHACKKGTGMRRK